MSLRAEPRARPVTTTRWSSPGGRAVVHTRAQESFLPTLADESVDCVWTDPPYLLSNDGTTCSAGRRRSVNKGGWDRSQGLAADHAWNLGWLQECRRVLKPAGTLWVSGTLHVYLSVGMALQELGFRILNDVIWEKPNPPPNLGCRCFTHATEVLLFATKAGRGSRARHTFHYADMKKENGGRQMKNVWRMPAPGAEEKRAGRHPTQKPLALIMRCLAASTNEDDLVLDPFCGSGSTAIAALRLGRRFEGCEIDAGYARLARRRIEQELAGGEAS